MKHLDLLNLLPLWQELLFIAVGVSSGIWAWLRARQAQSWPSAQGTIDQAVARRAGDRHYKQWFGQFIYDYVVNGEYYSGFHRIRTSTERRAQELTAGWKGRMVIVRYSPKDPQVSILLKSDQPGGRLGN
jgi:hypothetical protein